MEGRDWICPFCQRGYLKMESLVHHIKLKHLELRDSLKHIQQLRLGARVKQNDTPSDEEAQQSSSDSAGSSEFQSVDEEESQSEDEQIVGSSVDALEKFEVVWQTLASDIAPNKKRS